MARDQTPLMVTDGGVQRVALTDDVSQRITHLCGLATRLASSTLALAEALYVEHTEALWQVARTCDGLPYESEEHFWEDAIGIKRRSAYQLVAIGRMLTTLALPGLDRTALARVGLHKLDTLVPVLEQAQTPEVVRRWTEIARTQPREILRDAVREALGQPRRPASEPGSRFQTAVINVMPDLESRQLATEFFAVGAEYVGTDHAVAILIAGMQECLSTWSAHLVDPETAG